MSKKYQTHTAIIKLSLNLSARKEEIQRKLDTGEIESIAALAKLEGVGYSTMRNMCKELGINSARTRIRKDDKCVSLTALVAVIHRICVELKIDDRELLPYIHPHE
jgi:ribosome-interacting GTPase 1